MSFRKDENHKKKKLLALGLSTSPLLIKLKMVSVATLLILITITSAQAEVTYDNIWQVLDDDTVTLQNISWNVSIGKNSTTEYRLHVEGNISAYGGNSSNWNEAFNWGDHSLIGYLTSVDISSNTNLGATSPIILTGDTLSHSTTAGNKHIPTGGSTGQLLRNTGTSGTAGWSTVTATGGALSGVTSLAMGGALTGATGLISQWTNDVGYITSGGSSYWNDDGSTLFPKTNGRDVQVNGSLFFNNANTYMGITVPFPQKWLFITDMPLSFLCTDLQFTGDSLTFDSNDMEFNALDGGNILFHADREDSFIDFASYGGDIYFNKDNGGPSNISFLNENKLLMYMDGDTNDIDMYDTLNMTGHNITNANLSDYAGDNIAWDGVNMEFDATGGGSGVWNRAGTTLFPATDGDDVQVNGTITVEDILIDNDGTIRTTDGNLTVYGDENTTIGQPGDPIFLEENTTISADKSFTWSSYCSVTTDSDANYGTNVNPFDEDSYTSYSYTNNTASSGIDYYRADGNFTFVNSGVYMITFNAIMMSSASDEYLTNISKNGLSFYDHQYIIHFSVDPTERSITLIKDFAVDDVLRVFVHSADGVDTVAMQDGTTLSINRIA